MKPRYPRVMEWRRPKPRSQRACAICGSVPAGVSVVQVSIFRGDDEFVATCERHKKSPERPAPEVTGEVNGSGIPKSPILTPEQVEAYGQRLEHVWQAAEVGE